MHIFNSYTVHSKHIKLKIQHNLGKNNKKSLWPKNISYSFWPRWWRALEDRGIEDLVRGPNKEGEGRLNFLFSSLRRQSGLGFTSLIGYLNSMHALCSTLCTTKIKENKMKSLSFRFIKNAAVMPVSPSFFINIWYLLTRTFNLLLRIMITTLDLYCWLHCI